MSSDMKPTPESLMGFTSFPYSTRKIQEGKNDSSYYIKNQRFPGKKGMIPTKIKCNLQQFWEVLKLQEYKILEVLKPQK